ncbi:LytTR family transcriptional regulator [bacterium]|nr:LytTR family transcriptional regulator [bacterium]
MRFAVFKTKQGLLQLVAPELVCTFIGVIIGVITYGDDPAVGPAQNISQWVIYLNAGAVAHQLAWLLTLKVFRWETASTLKGIWKPTAMGVLITFLFILLLNIDDDLSLNSVLLMFSQIVAICIIVHVFLFQFKFYSFSNALFNPEKGVLSDDNSPGNGKDTLLLTVEERIEKVDLKMISHIKVEDHYCTVVYLKDTEWRQWIVYEKLKTFEQQYPQRLLRINRSTLVNPEMVVKVEKTGGKHLITMKGTPTTPFPLTPSQKHLLDHLIPIIT